MDLSHLPDNVFLKIVEYLPIQDCARLGRVNQAFHRMSQLVISCTKSLDLTNNRFRKLRADQLDVILDLCSPNLEKIKFPGSTRAAQMATTLATYECPRLTNINLGDTPIDYAVFERLIRNNSNLESLYWNAEFVGFPNVVSNNLKTLHLTRVIDSTLQSMTGRIPNLEQLHLINTNVTSKVLDDFFASTKQIQCIVISIGGSQIAYDKRVVNFWNLPLTSLYIELDFDEDTDDAVFFKVATSFPHLRRLCMENVSDVSSHGISALAALQELEILQLDTPYCAYDIEDGFRALVACKQLRNLRLSESLNSDTFITLLRGCPQLEFVQISDIKDVYTQDEAAIVLLSLSGIAKRNIIIKLNPIIGYYDKRTWRWLPSIWKSETAKEAIKELEQNEGFKIRFGIPFS